MIFAGFENFSLSAKFNRFFIILGGVPIYVGKPWGFINNRRLLIFLKNHVVLYMLVDTWHILNKEDLGNQIYLKSRDFI